MTPFQTFGATQAPSNMMFPTAAYLQASQNAADMQARGMSELAKGLAGGINAAVAQYSQHKDEQAKFDATKKMYSAFKNYLPEQSRIEIEKMFSDTGMSVREKNQISPMLMNMIAQGQQQAGRERIVELSNTGRVEAAGARRPAPMTNTGFGQVSTVDQLLDAPVGQPQANEGSYALPANPSQGNPAPLMQGQPKSRMTPDGRMEVWSSRLNRFVEIDNPVQDIQY